MEMRKVIMNYDHDKVILTDCDGVYLNWEYPFEIWMNSRGYKAVPDADKFSYGVENRFNITTKEKYMLIREFNSSAAIGFLPPLRDSIQYIQKLHREHGYVFHCITSLSKDRNAQKLRIMNTEKLFGPTVFEEYTFLGTGEDKYDILKEKYENTGLLWIEDKLENAVAGDQVGLSSILMEHGHNMIRSNRPEGHPDWGHADHIPRFENWKGIYNYIIGE